MIALAVGVFTLGLLAAPAHADGIELSVGDRIRLYNGVGDNPGGEFDAKLQKLSGSSWIATGLTWQTFCLETDEYFSSGGLQKVVGISDTAYGGGSNTNSGDPISLETAWLFTQFYNGTLVGLDSDGDLVDGDYLDAHAANATHLQEAIWYLEEETAYGDYNKYAKLAEDAVLNGGWNSIGNVRVMNLERQLANGSWVQAQDQLFMYSQPVPEPGTWALFGMGLAGLALHRRRRNARAS
jgi:hypothetical protein